MNPSNRVTDVFRRKNYGKVDAPANSKAATSDFFIDRSRLGTHEEYDPSVANEWGGTGRYIQKPNSIMDNVRGAMGGIGYKSSYRSVHEPAEPTSTEGPGCCSTPFGRDAKNPLTRLRGDD
jgi:hypothetical protein